MLDSSLPRRPPPPDRPPPPPPERLFADLRLPRRDAAPTLDDPLGEMYFFVYRPDGKILKYDSARSGAFPDDADFTASAPLGLVTRGEFRQLAMVGPNSTRIVVGQSIAGMQRELRQLAWTLAAAGAVALIVGLAGGWLVSARILRPIRSISKTASAISAANLSERIESEKVDVELQELAGVLNAMFDRLEAAFERQARFTADASHELRTPLAIIRTHAELALNKPRSAEDYRSAIEASLRAATRMTALVDGLLILARSDAGKLDVRRDPVELKLVVEEALDMFRPLAEQKKITLGAELGEAKVSGDPLRLGQVITNLLSNAVQYNRRGGAVRVEISRGRDSVVLAIHDTGGGIAPQDLSHLFERFYRVDPSRTPTQGGTGLGLAICKSIVEAHGGTIEVESKLGQGSTFRVRLPML
jgi:two-component system OmpR family sensor kinase